MSESTLDALMRAVGVCNAPAWFRQIRLPHWPRPHQLDDLQALVRHTRFGLFNDPGTGKTYPAQALAILMAALGDNRVVFVMPPKLLRQFEQEFHDFFTGIGAHLSIEHTDVSAHHKKAQLERWRAEGWPDILLTSYALFRRLASQRTVVKIPAQLIEFRDGGRFTRDGRPVDARGMAANPYREELRRAGYNVLVFDEAHALCNSQSQVFKAVQHLDRHLGEDVAIYLMTGTPVPTHLKDVYGILRLINRDAYANRTQFYRRHVLLDPFSKFEKILGYHEEAAIFQALYANARRVQKRDVSDMPEPVVTVTPIRLAGRHKKLYDKVLQDRFALLGDSVLSPDNDSALRMLALQLISCPEAFDESGASQIGAENALREWLDTLLDTLNPARRKVIIFSYFRSTISALARHLAHWHPAVLNGASVNGHREKARFLTDDSCRIFLLQWTSGGAGLNLQSNCSDVIFYEMPTSPKDYKQGVGRVDRDGQTEQVNVYLPRVIGTYADRNFKNLLKNEQQNNTAVRDKHDLLHQQLRVGR